VIRPGRWNLQDSMALAILNCLVASSLLMVGVGGGWR
jgi:hypothetical protein